MTSTDEQIIHIIPPAQFVRQDDVYVTAGLNPEPDSAASLHRLPHLFVSVGDRGLKPDC